MYNSDMDRCVSGIIECVRSIDLKKGVILDVSAYPYLPAILETDFAPQIYMPDVFIDLLKQAKKDERYVYFIENLLVKWTQRKIHVDEFIDIVGYGMQINKVNLIRKEMVDKDVYLYAYENFKSRNLMVRFSPEINLLGDIIGKVLGYTTKTGIPILMANRGLLRIIRNKISVIELANQFVDHKQGLFDRVIPVRRTRGLRWFLGITIGATITPAGLVLAIMDP